ncbi:MAG: hypothetical protein ACJ77A_14035 [Actinomycetota bacterium]
MEPETGPRRGVAPVTPVRVWISRLGTARNDVEGTLTLTPTHLRFDHRRGTDHEHVPLSAIRKVSRPLGSPVLSVEYAKDDEHVRLAFFFAQPPPVDLGAPEFQTRRKRSDNAGFMWNQSGDVAAVVKSWRNAIRQAVRAARRD